MVFRSREMLLVLAATACLVLLLGDRLVLNSLLEARGERAKRIAELQKMVSRGQALLDQEERWRRHWKRVGEIELPSQRSAAENLVLQRVDYWARKTRLSLTSLKPRRKTGAKGGERLILRAVGRGSMEAISRFLYEVETAPLALALEEIEISSRKEDGRDLTLDILLTGLLAGGAKAVTEKKR